jgi:GTP-binding protein HflX
VKNGSREEERPHAESAVVLHPFLKRGATGLRDAEACLEEAIGLAEAISLDVVHSECVGLSARRPATLFGSGAVETLEGVIAAVEAGVVIIDGALTPVQQRNLERAWKCKVLDRTGLILEIFGERARTREGRLQVELAHLSYQRSRLVRSWTHLERQRGGRGFMGGPGERQIEADRRQIDERITRLKLELETVTRTRALHRKARNRMPYPVVALVGYTNAGKSTLFNRLTDAEVFAEDQLFATLDPTMRAARLPSGRTVILSDTVGFVSALPTSLIAAFRATLEEVLEAKIIIHVRDIAHAETEAQREDVISVLAELGIDDAEQARLVEARNKIDLLSAEDREIEINRAARSDSVVAISAVTGEGCDGLLALIDERLRTDRRVLDLSLPAVDGAGLAWLYRHGDVLERRDDGADVHLRIALDPADAARFEARSGA